MAGGRKAKAKAAQKPDEARAASAQEDASIVNKLLRKITASLSELQRAIKGTVVMSKELDSMFQALLLQRVPDMWAKVSSSPNPRPSTFNAPPAARA